MSKYYGNILEDATIELAFNTFDSDGASVTVTDLATTDVEVYKDGTILTDPDAGVTLSLNVGTGDGSHLVIIDTSADAEYAVGSNYEVRLVGITVDTQTLNPFIGSFSIDNRAADMTKISGDASAADNIEATYDGTGYANDVAPATQVSVTGIANAGAATNEHAIASPNGFVITTGSNEVNNEDSTHAADGTTHDISDTAGTLDCYYIFDTGGAYSPVSVTWRGRLLSSNDELTLYVNTGTLASPSWQVRAVINGTNVSTLIEHVYKLFVGDKMTGADAGKVAIRFAGTGLTTSTLYTDQITVQKTSDADQTGYENGAIWYDDSASNTNSVPDVDGTARNPVSSWAAVKSLLASTGLRKVDVANGSSVILDANSDSYTIGGSGWGLDLNGQSIEGMFTFGANITGEGIASVTRPRFERCTLGTVTIPPSILLTCGFGVDEGVFTAGSAGQYLIIDGKSLVPGTGIPSLIFSGLGGSTGINNRGWYGGADYTLDADCVLSHEVDKGGETVITTGGALEVEVRGITREVVINASAAEVVQIIGVIGPITLNGTTTATFNLYGVSGSITDNTSAGTVNDSTLNQVNTADVVWDELLTGSSHNIATSAGRRLRQINSPVLLDGTSPGSNATTYINLDGDASATDGTYDPGTISIYEGTGAGQSRQVFEYDGSLKRAYVNRDWKVIPDATSAYLLVANSGDTHVNEGKAQGDGGGTDTIQLNTLASSEDDVYIGQSVFIVAGTGADQAQAVIAYVGSTQTATLEHDWPITPDTTSIYAMLPVVVHSIVEIQSGLSTFDPDNDDVAVVTLVTTTTTNTDMVAEAPTAIENRQEMDANSTRLDADVSSRAPEGEYDTEMARITADVATEAKQDIIDTNVDTIITTGSTGPWTTGGGGDATATNQDTILAKMLSYIRILARKDSAIATDDAAQVTEINADEGSGAGAFNNTTDSQEAIKDGISGGGGTPQIK